MILSSLLFAASAAHATDYTDYASWAAAAGAHSSISFGEVPLGTVLSTQYAGLTFASADDTQDGTGYTTDGFMLSGGVDITIDFASPQTSIAADFPGALQINLYDAAGTLVASSMNFGGSGSFLFGGVVSPVPFVRAVMIDHFNFSSVYIDNLYYSDGGAGPTIRMGGVCPSAVTVAGAGFTAGGNVAVVRAASTGSFTVPSGGCAGTMLGIGPAGIGLAAVVTASGTGTVSYSGAVGAGACSSVFQFVDLATCAVSNIDTF